MENKRIAGLDGLRAISVTLVILTHVGLFGRLPKEIYQIVQGTTGVVIFFTLSGFLITRLLILEHLQNGSISLRNFYLRRTLRIIPLYLTVVLVTCLIAWFVYPEASNRSIVFAMFFVTNFIDKSSYSGMLGHTWSLAVEEHFYLLWPMCLVFLIQANWRLAIAALAMSILASISIANILSSYSYLSANYFIDRWTFVAAIPIAMGALIAIIVTTDIAKGFLSLVKRPGSLVFATGLFCHTLLMRSDPLHVGNALRGAGAALFIGWLFCNQRSSIVRVLEFQPIRYVGLISYSIYMWQGFFLQTGPERLPTQTWPPSPAIGAVLVAIVAPLSFHFFESPILNLKRRYERLKLIDSTQAKFQ